MPVQHDRTIDHSGTQDATTVTLSAPVGNHPAGTTLQVVLADFVSRLTALESGSRRFASFSLNSFIRPRFTLDAVLKKTASASFTLNAVVVLVGPQSLTLDAVVRANSTPASFTLDAFLV